MDKSKRNVITVIIAAAVLLAATAVALAVFLRPPLDDAQPEYYLFENAIYKSEYPLDEVQLAHAADRINAVVAAHGEARSFTLAVVPDKNYYLPEDAGIPKMDYERLFEFMERQTSGINYVNLTHVLDLDAYYRTDPHWTQQGALGAADILCKEMSAFRELDYTENILEPFRGVYLKRSGLEVTGEKLVYLTSETTENAVVTSVETEGSGTVYRPECLGNDDSLDVFLGGAAAVQYIENPLAEVERELVIFRDSFGSAIAPLLMSAYSKVTLVDPRYILPELVNDYVNFEDADVLFLYSTLLLNNAAIMR